MVWVWCRVSGKVVWGEKEPEDGGEQEDGARRPPPGRAQVVWRGAAGQPEEGDGAFSAPSPEVTG